MARSISYADAARLLGGGRSPVISVLDSLAGGVILGASVAVPGLLGLVDGKDEFVRLSAKLVRRVGERSRGLGRYDRTQRLVAAHSVIVISAYFAGLDSSVVPFGLSRREQLSLVSGGHVPQGSRTSFVDDVLTSAVPLPSPQQPAEQYVEQLSAFYAKISRDLLRDLDIRHQWDDDQRDHAEAFLRDDLPSIACRRYDEMFRQLAIDCPEVAHWAGAREHQATRTQLGVALDDLRLLLTAIGTGRTPDQRRASLARAYQAALTQPIVETGDVPADLEIPTLGASYVDPRFRVAEVAPGSAPSQESWWHHLPIRDDLGAFLGGYLTAPEATRSPLIVLGQPGSGKSVLTRMLAATLPPGDFLPVRVVLREVPAEADLQDQIEYAVRSATSEALSWPDLARSADGALPVLLLDGFDELLQATGLRQTDYLAKIVAFQRREIEQGRAVAVVVTSRTAVADRARIPQGTVALRLEPFDSRQIQTWLSTWNKANAHTTAIEPASVLAYPDLAEQPLLLLMLALYAADRGVLHDGHDPITRSELYERLLTRFARREVDKHALGLSDEDAAVHVEDELRRLSVAAFAMFNRDSQWILETDLVADLSALLPTRPQPAGLRAALNAAEVLLGRFFFIQEARALRDENVLRAYEFLHATFGEYLVARLVWQVLRGMASQQSMTQSMPFAPGPPDDGLLYSLLSYSLLSTRAPVVDFLASVECPESEREAIGGLLLNLFRTLHSRPADRGPAGYQPAAPAIAARYAAYSANLVLLAVIVKGEVLASELFDDIGYRTVVIQWHREIMLWRSQMSNWRTMAQVIALTRIGEDDHRDLHLTPGVSQQTTVDPEWTYGGYESSAPSDSFAREENHPRYAQLLNNFMCGINDDVVHHTMEPLVEQLGDAVNLFVSKPDGSYSSAARALLDLWLLPDDAPSSRRDDAFTLCAMAATDGAMPAQTQLVYLQLFIDKLVSAIGEDPDRNRVLLNSLGLFLSPHLMEHSPILLLEGWLPVAERGLLAGSGLPSAEEIFATVDLTEVGRTRPDLVFRARSIQAALLRSSAELGA